MRKLLFLVLVAVPASAGQEAMCRVVIEYPPTNPEQIALTVPDKHCDVRGIKHALGYILFRLNQD